MASLNKLLPEGGATVDQGDGFGHVSITVVSQHSALHPFMKHLHFSLETEQEVTGEHQKTPPPPQVELHFTCTRSQPGRSGCTGPLWSRGCC